MHIDAIDSRRRRSMPHGLHDAIDPGVTSGREELDAAVGTVPHPAPDSRQSSRFPHVPTEAHPLHAAACHDAHDSLFPAPAAA
jgi:hypothetical protein